MMFDSVTTCILITNREIKSIIGARHTLMITSVCFGIFSMVFIQIATVNSHLYNRYGVIFVSQDVHGG